jgi:hypothetical protein
MANSAMFSSTWRRKPEVNSMELVSQFAIKYQYRSALLRASNTLRHGTTQQPTPPVSVIQSNPEQPRSF